MKKGLNGVLVSATVALTFQQGAAGATPPTPAQPAVSVEIDARVRNEVLSSLARELEAQYAIPDVATQLAATVRARQKSNAYQNITMAPALARALTNDLLAVAHDKHLRVVFSFAPIPPAQNPAGPLPEAVLTQIRKQNGAIVKVEILDGNVGYMRVNGVPPLEGARSAVAAAFAFLHNTDALIIDNRGNNGGDPSTVALYVSYLSEGASYVINTFHWREGNQIQEFKTTDLGELSYGAHKPVFVLTSGLTFSGGEEMTYDLQVFKRAVIVGEQTGGGANPGGPVPLGHQFVVNMPRGRAVNPITRTSWEGVGVKPDVPVSPADALYTAHALAIRRLAAEAPDTASRSMLDAVSMKLQTVEEADQGTAERLTNSAVVGTYAMEGGPGAAVTILEDGNHLVESVAGFPDVPLAFLKGNRYKAEGLPDGSFTSFRVQDGKTELLLEVPFGPPTIRAKR